MSSSEADIVYTLTDESPRLATYSLLPIVQAFAGAAGVNVQTADISLAGRILAAFPGAAARGPAAGSVPVDALAELAELAKQPRANIIKLPNISASVPQLLAAITELRAQGVELPDFPANPATDEERAVRKKYDQVLGSAVNPVLRQGNSDRRAPRAVKEYARKHPHRNQPWDPDSPTNVATMAAGDFYHNEASMLVERPTTLTITFQPESVETPAITINDAVVVGKNDVFDASYMSASALDAFLADQVARAQAEGLLFSAHLKATMMKVSDPVIFGHAIQALLPKFWRAHGAELTAHDILPQYGLATIGQRIAALPNGPELQQAMSDELAEGPNLAMVDSDKGITAFHVPSDVIIDASMPAMIRAGGRMWGADGELHPVLCVIPDSSYAGVYQTVIDDFRQNGALDPATAGSVSNVGLMAMAAEEYGSHDKTLVAPTAGKVSIVSSTGPVVEQHLAAGDIWRASLTKAAAIRDWVRLAVERSRIAEAPVVFWLDNRRPHDAVLIQEVESALAQIDCDGADIHLMDPASACAYSLARMRAGLDTISATGNVLRDYLTDLFPILELGTSAKMLSVVPLLAGGGMFETGAGGSAPRQAEQLIAENHLRWDSLGEYLALAAAFEQLARTRGNTKAAVLADTLDQATSRYLEENRAPGRKVGTLDTRGSHFYLAQYWARALADQTRDAELAANFAPVAAALEGYERQILDELAAGEGEPTQLGGYFQPDPELADAIMRPSQTLNSVLAAV